MKYLDLTDLARALAIKLECSVAAATKFVDVQDAYFEKTGVNVDPDSVDENSIHPVVIDDAEMRQYIVDNAGLAEPFVQRLMDAEREYMEKEGLITDKGEVLPFIKTKR